MKKIVKQTVLCLVLMTVVLVAICNLPVSNAAILTNPSEELSNQPASSFNRVLVQVIINYVLIFVGLLSLIFEVVWIKKFISQRRNGISIKKSLIWVAALIVVILLVVYLLLVVNLTIPGGVNIRLTL